MKVAPSQLKALDIIARGQFYPDFVHEDDGWHARWQPIPEVDDSVAGWLDEYVRTAALTPLSANAEDDRHATLHDAWIAALKSKSGLVRQDEESCQAFAAELARWHNHGEDAKSARREIVLRFDAGESAVSCALPRGRAALRAIGEATFVFGPLRGMKRTKGRSPRLSVTLSRAEAEHFLSRGARDLIAADYRVEGCDLAAAITASAEILDLPGSHSREDSMRVKLVVRVAGQPVTAAEIRFLLEQNSTLVFFREHWIEVDRNILKEALRALEKSGQCRFTRAQALAFASGIGRIGRLEIDEAASHGWLRGLLNRLRQARDVGTASTAARPWSRLFRGELRDYQKRGVAWLSFLTRNGFGALLADDMGLGKTIQTIAWALAENEHAILVVAPLTLLANWKHEFATFAPSMKVYVHQGRNRHVASGFNRAAAEADVVLTSYNLLVRDHALFSEIAWDAMVLDEAQAIKNPNTAVARAVRALTPPKRIALTGTPIENSVEDIWSIEEFLNPGFLGERKSFIDRFAKPLERDPHATAGARLRHALEPFVLRRLKSDDGVAAELGPKREIREYCSLTPRGRADYEDALAVYRESEKRRGDVFTLLTRLKLVCDGAGKFERLAELVGQIGEAGESVLIFTQYAKVGRELKTRLEERMGRRVSFLHGALSARQREAEIAHFQNACEPSCFILSLRAGGFGLNLTRATHVIHYDRWWNPAVENQATDRAHRIGQARTVFVHLMMTAGTIEEHVDEILSRKTAVSGGLVASGEAFLSQLPPEIFEKAVALDE